MRVQVLTSLGEAEKRAGDPAHRDHLLAAVRLADELGDVEGLARAALANSRGTMSSAGQVDAERTACLEQAVEAIGDRNDALKARLLANLAMELTWGASLERRNELSGDAVATARRLGDPAVLCPVLISRIAAIWHPSTVHERLEASREALVIAEEIGDPVAQFWGLYRRFNALLETGQVQDIDQLVTGGVEVADAVGQPFLRSVAHYMRGTRLIVSGRLADAEVMAEAARKLAQQAAQPDAEVFFLCQLSSIRFEQGLGDETLAAGLSVLAEQLPNAPVMTAMLASAQLDLGRTDRARSTFEACAASSFTNVPDDMVWSPTMAFASRICAALHDQERALTLHRLIAPYDDLAAAHTLMWLRSFNHYLGILDVTLGRLDDANERFAAATTIHNRAGARCSQAHTNIEWALMLQMRRRPGDTTRAGELLKQAVDTARELGLSGIERRAVELC